MSAPEDEIDRRVKQAVKEALAEERREAAARQASDHKNHQRLTVEAELSALERAPRTWGALARRRASVGFATALVVLLIGGEIPVELGLDALGATPAGLALCPVQCEGCSGPGRLFIWRYRGPWRSNKGSMGSALVCQHPSLTLESMTWVDVSRGDALQPYILSGFVRYPFNAFSVAAVVGVLYGLWGTGARLRRNAARRAELSEQQRGA